MRQYDFGQVFHQIHNQVSLLDICIQLLKTVTVAVRFVSQCRFVNDELQKESENFASN